MSEHEDLAYARRAKAAAKATELLTHYMQQAWEAAGLPWGGDNESEMAEVVDLIIEAGAS
jgi:hypothetical protein